MPGPDLPTRHKPDACSKVTPSAKLEWIVASLQRQQGEQQPGWPPPSTPPGGGAVMDLEVSSMPSHCHDVLLRKPCDQADIKMDPEHVFNSCTSRVNASKASASAVAANNSESLTSMDYDSQNLNDHSPVSQKNCDDRVGEQTCTKKNVNDNEMTDQCKTSSSFGLSSADVVSVTQAQSRPVPSSICRIPKKRGLVLAEDKLDTVAGADSGCQEASTSNSLASASDFLQKLVQEQKSQVPTLFCRSDEKTCSAKALSNNVPNTKANLNLIKLLKKPDNQPHADTVRSQADVETTSPSQTQFTFQYDSVSSDDEVESVTTKDEVKAQRIAETTVSPSEPASGKLRFYLDGRFVLELTHAASGTSSNSTGWVQSKGKIWTPSSEAADSGALRVGVGKPAIDTPCPPPHIRPMSSGEGISSVNSPFLLRIGRAVRAIYLCWLTSKELRKAARNPAVDASLLYQAALTRNSPIMGMARMDKNLKMKLSTCQRKRRRRPLRGVWKELFANSGSSPGPSSSVTSALTSEHLTEEETKTNHSLLLDALTKPKTRDISDSSDVGTNSSSFLSSITVSIPVESKEQSHPCKKLTDKADTDSYSRSESGVNRGCKTLVPGSSSGSNSEHSASSLLPLPEWYLDPSKAEVPISEMIGYPRPYFPPAAVHNSPCHIIRKRQQGSTPVSQFSPPNGKRVRLKQEQRVKECIAKEASTNVVKTVGDKVEICTTTDWPLWPTKVEPEENTSVSTLPVSLVCSSRQVESNNSQSSITNIDLAAKVRNAKRFGSYGRGHAVNDAIRTFVISDIVNLGGDLKTRYVPRGVYSEVASRYKIDVSTTTRWWLRHCAEKEQDKKFSSSTATVPTMKSDLPRPVVERGDHETASIKVEAGTERQSPSAMHRLSWGSSVTSSPSRMPSIISAHTRPMSEPLWTSGLNSRLSDQATEIPYTISKRSSSMEKVAASKPDEDGPLDLRVTSKRLRTVKEPIKSTVDAVVPSAHHLAASVRPPSVEYTVHGDRMLCSQSPNYVHDDHNSSDKLVESNVQRLSPCERVPVPENRLGSHEDRINHWVMASHPVRTSVKAHKSVVEVSHNGNLSDRSTLSPSSDEVLDVGSHETNSPISFCKSGPAVISTEFPMLSSALKSPLPSTESNGLTRKTAVEEHSSQEERTILAHSTSSDANTTNSDVYTAVNSKFGARGYSSLPVPPIHPEYPPLGPPPAGLPPWPYPPCPLMAYGPALVNSYYYCCCFLPGCRFHYVYTADGRPVDPRETSPSPLVLADNYSKCFSGVADVAPLMYNSVRSEQVYKNWSSPVSEPRTANASPSSPSPAREQDDDNDKVQAEDPQSTESTGSMLKDLLLKPSRTTPDRAQPLVTSSKTLVVNEKIPLTCNPVKVENFLNSHRDHVHGVASSPAASPSLTAKECSAKLSRARGSSPLASPRAKKDDAISSDLTKAYWENSTFPKSACQPKHYSFQMGTILDTEES